MKADNRERHLTDLRFKGFKLNGEPIEWFNMTLGMRATVLYSANESTLKHIYYSVRDVYLSVIECAPSNEYVEREWKRIPSSTIPRNDELAIREIEFMTTAVRIYADMYDIEVCDDDE